MIEQAWNYKSVVAKDLEGSDSNGVGIEYYKVNLDNAPDDMFTLIKQIVCMFATEMKAIYGEAEYGFSNFSIGPAGFNLYNTSGNFKPLAIGVASYIKIIGGILDDNDNITDKDSMIFEGTLKEIVDIMTKELKLPFNPFDYLEPITEEEFYKID